MGTIGVDFDKRCNKYRVRLTREGIVYLINYFSSEQEACDARKEALRAYDAGEPFAYLHSYEASSKKKEETDDYLEKLNISLYSYVSSPLRVMLVAVLMQAIKDRLSAKNQKIKQEAIKWFESDLRDSLKFSFLDICDELGLDSINVLHTVQGLEDQKRPSRRLTGRRLVRTARPVDSTKKG